MANLLLAAAVGNRWLGQVHEWASNTNEHRAGEDPREARLPACPPGRCWRPPTYPNRQRDGLYGTALKICAFMEVRDTMELVTPPSQWHHWPDRDIPARAPQFDPYEFVWSTSEGRGQTLYLLSREGEAERHHW